MVWISRKGQVDGRFGDQEIAVISAEFGGEFHESRIDDFDIILLYLHSKEWNYRPSRECQHNATASSPREKQCINIIITPNKIIVYIDNNKKNKK